MTTWAGWQEQLLAVATAPDNDATRGFLNDWHKHASTDCANNPVDISLNISGASPCKLTDNPNHRARNYASNDQAAGQFRAQLRSGNYPNLLAALASGNPYRVDNSDKVTADLVEWGSSAFANYFRSQINNAISGGHIRAPHALGGWQDVQRSWSRHLPKTLRESNRHSVRALQSLASARKVRL